MSSELKDMVKSAALESIKEKEEICGIIQEFVLAGFTPVQIEKMFMYAGARTLAIGAYWYAKELLEARLEKKKR